MGDTVPSLLRKRFQDRLQILLECFPYVWVFRARKDIAEVHIWGADIIGIDLDREVLADIAQDAHYILVHIFGSLSWDVTHLLVDVLDVFDEKGFHSRRAPFTKLEKLISDIENYATWYPAEISSSESSYYCNLTSSEQQLFAGYDRRR